MVGVRKFGGLDTFPVGGIEPSEGDVFSEGVRKEEGLLRDITHGSSQHPQGNAMDFGTVNKDRILRRLQDPAHPVQFGQYLGRAWSQSLLPLRRSSAVVQLPALTLFP